MWLLEGTCLPACVYVLACPWGFSLILGPCHCVPGFVYCICGIVCLCPPRVSLYLRVRTFLSRCLCSPRSDTGGPGMSVCPGLIVCSCPCPSPVLSPFPQGEPLPFYGFLLGTPWCSCPSRPAWSLGPDLAASRGPRLPFRSRPQPAPKRVINSQLSASSTLLAASGLHLEGPATSTRCHCHHHLTMAEGEY